MKVLAETTVGKLVTSDKLVYFLTPCCDASGTGTMDGVSCRACYQTVDWLYGWGVSVNDPKAERELALTIADGWGDKLTDYHLGFAKAMLASAQRVYRTPVEV